MFYGDIHDKNFSKKLLLDSILFIGTQLSSATAANLKATDTLSISSINAMPTTLFKPIKLTTGKIVVGLQYKKFFNFNSDDCGNTVKSEPLYFVIDINHGNDYQIMHPKIITEHDALNFIASPTIYLNVNGKK